LGLDIDVGVVVVTSADTIRWSKSDERIQASSQDHGWSLTFTISTTDEPILILFHKGLEARYYLTEAVYNQVLTYCIANFAF
jgi:hypothetical protein